MASQTRSASTLGRRSFAARIVAVLALAACGVAIYFLVMSFTDDKDGGESKNEKKGRSEEAKSAKQAWLVDAEVERLNPGRILALR